MANLWDDPDHKQLHLRGNVMYDRLTNPKKFADYKRWNDDILDTRNAYNLAHEMLSDSKYFEKRMGQVASNKQQIEYTELAKFYLNKSIAGDYVEKTSWLDSHIDKWRSQNVDTDRALEIIDKVKKEGIPLSELKEIAESLDRKYWTVREAMLGGEMNDPKIDRFEDILARTGGNK